MDWASRGGRDESKVSKSGRRQRDSKESRSRSDEHACVPSQNENIRMDRESGGRAERGGVPEWYGALAAGRAARTTRAETTAGAAKRARGEGARAEGETGVSVAGCE